MKICKILALSMLSMLFLLSHSSVFAAKKEHKHKKRAKVENVKSCHRSHCSCPGPRGPEGPRGPRGLQGPTGPTGSIPVGHNSLVFNAGSMLLDNLNPSELDPLPLPASNEYISSWELSDLDSINLTFNVPNDFDPSEQPVVIINFVTDNNDGESASGSVVLQLNTFFVAPEGHAVPPASLPATLTLTAIPVTSAADNYLFYDALIALLPSPPAKPPAPRDFAFLSINRSTANGDTYVPDIYVTSIEFRYKVRAS